MAVIITEGKSGDVLSWIEESSLSEADKEALRRFVQCFKGLTFFKQTLGGTPPAWLSDYCGVLSGFERGQQIWVQFDGFDHGLVDHPLADKIPDTWYRLTKQVMVADEHEKVIFKEKMLYFVGVDMEHYKTMLALRFDEEDRSIYEFDYQDVHPNGEDDEEELEELEIPMDGFGYLETAAATPVFDSYCSMYGHIKAIRFQDGCVLEAKV
ncbi:hypothetical protein [Anaerocolumna chitinilytica]|uniref:Uncharacterized protein n=1 Tax=Anaerocolumna chitinilytica TaxID=1727145 RepID=A0A7I8DP85_9FIRM|nr:hypothetical protein [Anaerocolumna chitinilytica]BCJ99081.1 hypothetical protein bsdcttw_21220 [Anaerocolumna chitinilytica]